MALSFLALLFLSFYLKMRRILYAYLCWFVVGIVLLTKVEVFAGVFGSMLLSWALILRAEKSQATIIAIRSITFAFLLMLPLSLAGVFFSHVSTFSGAILRVLNPYLLMFHRGHSFSPMLMRVMGADQPLANTGRMLYWLCIYVLVALIVIAANHMLSALSKNTKHRLDPQPLLF
jgi:4-amino-4-deoxy-L-arabinose transferase-like glycosyltransferase